MDAAREELRRKERVAIGRLCKCGDCICCKELRLSKMKLLSTGAPSTWGEYRKLSVIFFGENSKEVRFVDKEIARAPNGADEEVIADETQVIYLITNAPKQHADIIHGSPGYEGD